ncbi:MAG: TonB-dependent receptor [Bacteroidota bacterium]
MKKRILPLSRLFVGCAMCLTWQGSSGQSWASINKSEPTLTSAERQTSKTLKQALADLEAKHHVYFIYESGLIDEKSISGANALGGKLDETLKSLLQPLDLKFEKLKNNVYVIVQSKSDKQSLKAIKQKLNGSFDAANAGTESNQGGISETLMARLAQTYGSMQVAETTIKGKVSSEDGEALPGVSVLVKGTTNGTATGIDGSYSLNVPDNATLVFSFIGYLSEEVVVGNRSVIDIKLVPDVQALGEIVVVAYGTQKRTSVTGAISSVSAKDITALPVPSVEQSIQGRVPGILVVNNGQPGDAPIVRLRGINSINYASGPLYVVDGIPQVGNFSNFDSRDIESVEVLKDANSAALYGSRAAAGVILISTKKGSRDGKLHVSLDSYYGVQTAWKQLDLLNTEQYVKYGTTLLTNGGQALPSRFSSLNDPIYTGSTQTYAQTNTDWQKEMFRSAAITHNSVAVSGGNENSRFFTSVGYFKQEGIMLGTGFERVNLRINSDHKISKVFTFGQTLLVSYSKQNQEPNLGGRTQLKNIIAMPPYIPVLDPTQIGGYRGPANGIDSQDAQNPVRSALQDISTNQNVRLLGSVFLEAAIKPWLKYRLNVGMDFNAGRLYQYNPIYNESFNARSQASLLDTRTTYFSPVVTNLLTFEKTLDKHLVNVIGGIEHQKFTTNSLTAAGNSNSTTIYELNGLSDASVNAVGPMALNDAVMYSYFGRLNYEYAGKYLLSASIRYDGASHFAPGKKFGTFPSIGLGWRISEEAFLKNNPTISELKIRGSYGLLGNIPGNYLWQSTISTGTNAIFNGKAAQGAFFNQLGNPALAWEVTKMTNIGLDMGFLSNRITFTAEYYSRRSDNLILNVPIVPSQGFSNAAIANIGDMTNSGLEFQLGYNKTQGDFKWNVSANLSTVSNKVNKLSTEKSSIPAGAVADYGGGDITRTEAGHPVQSFYGYVTDGILKSDASGAKAGDIRFKDISGPDGKPDGQITPDDRTYLGSFLPDFLYGLNFSANYKGFDLTLFLQGSQGNKIYNGTKVISQGMLRLFNASTDVLNAWTPTNTETNIPRAVSGDPSGNTRTSDRFVEDGSYLRLKNISLGYTVPASALQSFTKGTLSTARIYVSAQNLLTFTKYTSYDPEIGSRFGAQLTSGIDYGQFPAARTIMIGVQVGF